MQLAEALALLELPAGAAPPPAELRRAYLKRLKKVNPETDPQGFMRLREAYELLNARAVAIADAVGDTDAKPESSVPLDLDGSLPVGPAAPIDRFAPWVRLIEQSKPAERLETAREALATLPDDPRARMVLLSLLVRNGREAFEVLLEGATRSPDIFADELLWRFPGGVPLDKLAPWTDGAPARRLLLIANAYAEQLQGAQAGDALARGLAAVTDTAERELLPLALRPIFTLCARLRIEEARAAFRLLDSAKGAAVREVGVDQRSVILFAVVRELVEIADRLPEEFLRVTAATAFGEADQEQFSARVKAERLSILGDWQLNRVLRRAPTLAKFLSLDKQSRKVHRRLARGPILLPGGGVIMFCLWMAVRMVPTCLGSNDHPYVAPEVVTSPRARSGILRVTLLERCSRALMTDARLCDALRPVADGLDVEDPVCSSVRLHLGLAKSASLAEAPAELVSLANQLAGLVEERCPP